MTRCLRQDRTRRVRAAWLVAPILLARLAGTSGIASEATGPEAAMTDAAETEPRVRAQPRRVRVVLDDGGIVEGTLLMSGPRGMMVAGEEGEAWIARDRAAQVFPLSEGGDRSVPATTYRIQPVGGEWQITREVEGGVLTLARSEKKVPSGKGAANMAKPFGLGAWERKKEKDETSSKKSARVKDDRLAGILPAGAVNPYASTSGGGENGDGDESSSTSAEVGIPYTNHTGGDGSDGNAAGGSTSSSGADDEDEDDDEDDDEGDQAADGGAADAGADDADDGKTPGLPVETWPDELTPQALEPYLALPEEQLAVLLNTAAAKNPQVRDALDVLGGSERVAEMVHENRETIKKAAEAEDPAEALGALAGALLGW